MFCLRYNEIMGLPLLPERRPDMAFLTIASANVDGASGFKQKKLTIKLI